MPTMGNGALAGEAGILSRTAVGSFFNRRSGLDFVFMIELPTPTAAGTVGATPPRIVAMNRLLRVCLELSTRADRSNDWTGFTTGRRVLTFSFGGFVMQPMAVVFNATADVLGGIRARATRPSEFSLRTVYGVKSPSPHRILFAGRLMARW